VLPQLQLVACSICRNAASLCLSLPARQVIMQALLPAACCLPCASHPALQPACQQVTADYERVCAGCVNADSSSKTFVRQVGAEHWPLAMGGAGVQGCQAA
jgi:hypothetical protein